MSLVHRCIVPLIVAALSVASLVATAGEWTPVHFSPASVPQNARVIVKYKAGSSMAKALSATTGGAKVPQHAQTLGARLGLALVDGRGMDSRTQLVHASGISSDALAQRLAQDADVEWVVPDRRVRARMVPNDALFPELVGRNTTSPYYVDAGQWYLQSPNGTIPAAINAVAAWDLEPTLGAGQVVAVLDTGIRPEHPDLKGNRLLTGYNMISLNTAADGQDAAGKCITGNGACRTADAIDPGDWVSPADRTAHPTLFGSSCLLSDGSMSPSSWHGTQVASIVGANTNNSIGVAGIASQAKILPVRVLGKCGGFDSDIIDAMRWAAGLAVAGVPTNVTNPAKVINLSLGGAGVCGPAYQSAVDDVVAAGSVVVVAAGNEGQAVNAPANCSGVVSVGGLRQVGTKNGYASLGPEVTLSAPAGNCVNVDLITGNPTGPCLYPIVTALNAGTQGAQTAANGSIYSNSVDAIAVGTSFSAPQVSGVVALMLAARQATGKPMPVSQVLSALQSTAKAFPATGADTAIQSCRAPTAVAQDQCYCTTSTCGAGMLDAAGAVRFSTTGPFAAISLPAPVAFSGSTLTLDGSASRSLTGAIAAYHWEVLSGSGLAMLVGDSTAPTISLSLTGTGSVQVRLSVTDSAGTALTTQVVESVAMTPKILASNLSPVVGDVVSLSADPSTVSGNSRITGYSWEISQGTAFATITVPANTSTVNLSAKAAGAVTVKLTLTNEQGLTQSTSATLNIAKAPSVGVPGGSSGGGAWSPLWSLGLLLAVLALPARHRQRH